MVLGMVLGNMVKDKDKVSDKELDKVSDKAKNKELDKVKGN
jgi:hypothetical protein